ncbi:MAG TPA: HXXEE domain-containing protein [Pseudonocardiaceae bacterium]
MSVGTAAFLVIVLFTVHEFDEIIRVVPWIGRRAADPRFARDTWISRRDSYPSTEAVAAMIGEEIVLLSLILAVAVVANAMPVVLAVAAVNSIHLITHLVLAGRVRAWNPGSVTAAITLLPNIALIVLAIAQGMSVVWWLVATAALELVLAANLSALHRLAPTIHKRIQ